MWKFVKFSVDETSSVDSWFSYKTPRPDLSCTITLQKNDNSIEEEKKSTYFTTHVYTLQTHQFSDEQFIKLIRKQFSHFIIIIHHISTQSH